MGASSRRLATAAAGAAKVLLAQQQRQRQQGTDAAGTAASSPGQQQQLVPDAAGTAASTPALGHRPVSHSLLRATLGPAPPAAAARRAAKLGFPFASTLDELLLETPSPAAERAVPVSLRAPPCTLDELQPEAPGSTQPRAPPAEPASGGAPASGVNLASGDAPESGVESASASGGAEVVAALLPEAGALPSPSRDVGGTWPPSPLRSRNGRAAGTPLGGTRATYELGLLRKVLLGWGVWDAEVVALATPPRR